MRETQLSHFYIYQIGITRISVFQKLCVVGEMSGFNADSKPVVHSSYRQLRLNSVLVSIICTFESSNLLIPNYQKIMRFKLIRNQADGVKPFIHGEKTGFGCVVPVKIQVAHATPVPEARRLNKRLHAIDICCKSLLIFL